MPREPHAHPDASASLSLTRRTSFAKLLDFAVIFGGAIFGLWMCAGCSKPENPTPPAERVAQAWEAFRQTEYDEATKRFQSIQSETSKESDRHIEALYGEAACAHHRQSERDLNRAFTLYERIQKQHPRSSWAAWAALAAIRARHLAPSDMPIPSEALSRDYARLYQEHPDTPAGEEAFLYHSRMTASLGTRSDAETLRQEITDFLNRHPRTAYEPLLETLLAECHHLLGREDDRIAAMERSIAAFERDPTVPFYELSSAYWNIAYAAEFEAGNFPVARKYYGLFLKEFPNEDRAFGCRQALARMDRVEAALREGRPPEAEWLAAPKK